MSYALTAQAKEILRANDRGGFTVPTARLYPYQWNWDSAFAALGFATFDRDRAWRELEMLFEGQWPDGMVPHIIFRRDDPDYFPGPGVWQTHTSPPSSGHSQPPVAASVIRALVETGDERDAARARTLFPKIFAYHDWFHTMRDPDGTGVIGIVHPWESGRDNCPDWDGGMDNIVVPDDLGPYQRRDLGHIDASERPTAAQYDRFLTIVKFGRECGWDHVEIARNGPFFMADPGVHFILMRADRDLLWLGEALKIENAGTPIDAWLARSQAGCAELWNPQTNSFCARDLKTGTFSDGITNASMLAFNAGAGTAAQRNQMALHAAAIMDQVTVGFPSWDPRHPRFEARRYWRGPIWGVMNFMIVQGLADQGETELAARIKADTIRLIETAGFFEYFDPLTGDGLGGGQFTWTAAIYLAWSTQDER